MRVGETMEIAMATASAPDVTELRTEIERLQSDLNATIEKVRELSGE